MNFSRPGAAAKLLLLVLLSVSLYFWGSAITASSSPTRDGTLKSPGDAGDRGLHHPKA